VKPDLVMISSTGLGGTGPNRGHVTWGPNIEALSALATLSGFPQRECTITQYAHPDATSALHGLVAVMAALAHRDRTGEGQAIDLSQYEVAVAGVGHLFLAPLADDTEPARIGNDSPDNAPHGCYRCAGDDRWCVIAVRSDDEWRRLCEAMGKGALAGNARFATAALRVKRRKEVDREIGAWTAARDAYTVMQTLQDAGVAAGVVQTIADQLERDGGARLAAEIGACSADHLESATDDDYQAIEAVIAHEYFHNWTGNRVTCRDWFQLTLKEGLTVYRDQEFSADMGSRAVKRIIG